VAVEYVHRVSRAGDAQLHSHVVMASLTRADGRWTTLDGQALYAHLKTASILLSTSHFEGFPAVLVEAAAAGVPIVSTPCSITLPDILLDPTFGLVVPAEDVLLARAIHVVGARQRAPNSSLLAKFIDQHQLGRSAGLWLDWMDSVLVKRART